MSNKATFRELVRANIYHHYLLDDGKTLFDLNATLKTEQLSKYSMFDFVKVVPSKVTQQHIVDQKMIFSSDDSGFTLFARGLEITPNSGNYEPFIALDQSATFTFLIYITDPLFENYSTVGPVPQIPYLFTNKKPVTEGGGFPYMDVESTTSLIEDFAMTQDSYDEILTELSPEETIGLFGIVRLEMAGDDTVPVDGNARNILSSSGELLSPVTTFKIQLKNRSTLWNYINAVTGTVIHTSVSPQPLVKNGIVGYTDNDVDYPSAGPTRLIFEKDINGNIINTFSEIYIN